MNSDYGLAMTLGLLILVVTLLGSLSISVFL